MRRPLLSFGALLFLASAPPVRAQTASPPYVPETETRGSAAGALRWPVAVASAAADEIVVADAHLSRLVVFRRIEGGFTEERVVTLPAPPIALTAAGDRYVAALRGESGLAVVERRGFTVGRLGLPQGTEPRGLAAAGDGSILVLDTADGEVLVVTASGGVARRMPAPAGTRSILPAAAGGFFAALPVEGRILACAADGAVRTTIPLPRDGPVPAWPVAIADAGGGRSFVLDRHSGRVLLLDAAGGVSGWFGRRGWEAGALSFPAAIAVLPDGRVAIADQGNARLVVYRRALPEGTP